MYRYYYYNHWPQPIHGKILYKIKHKKNRHPQNKKTNRPSAIDRTEATRIILSETTTSRASGTVRLLPTVESTGRLWWGKVKTVNEWTPIRHRTDDGSLGQFHTYNLAQYSNPATEGSKQHKHASTNNLFCLRCTVKHIHFQDCKFCGFREGSGFQLTFPKIFSRSNMANMLHSYVCEYLFGVIMWNTIATKSTVIRYEGPTQCQFSNQC